MHSPTLEAIDIMARVEIAPMTDEFARQISRWRYPPPYDCYDMTGADPAFLADPASGFHALVDGAELIGFRSFGPDGQVPGWAYDDSALDTGGGLRPDLTGRGLGRAAITVGLRYGIEVHAPSAYRMTVAAFNTRAHRVVESLGFERIAEFDASTDGRRFAVFTAAIGALR